MIVEYLPLTTMKIKYFIFALAFLAATAIAQAQNNFEGVVVMQQSKGEEDPIKIIWYIKKDKLAYDLEFKTPEGVLTVMRFVPNPATKMLLITDPQATFRYEVPISSIQATTDVKKGMTAKETGRGNIEPQFEKMVTVAIETPNSKTEMEYTTDIIIDWSLYSDFFVSDYSIAAMIKLDAKGFPYMSTSKDEKGEVVLLNELLYFRKEKISDTVFK
jgi:hypothetical protein